MTNRDAAMLAVGDRRPRNGTWELEDLGVTSVNRLRWDLEGRGVRVRAEPMETSRAVDRTVEGVLRPWLLSHLLGD